VFVLHETVASYMNDGPPNRVRAQEKPQASDAGTAHRSSWILRSHARRVQLLSSPVAACSGANWTRAPASHCLPRSEREIQQGQDGRGPTQQGETASAPLVWNEDTVRLHELRAAGLKASLTIRKWGIAIPPKCEWISFGTPDTPLASYTDPLPNTSSIHTSLAALRRRLHAALIAPLYEPGRLWKRCAHPLLPMRPVTCRGMRPLLTCFKAD
jgi:hypothetical protein